VTRLGIALAVVFAGCVAVGMPTSSDPAVKLAQATEMFDRRGRPVPAEALIQEAIGIYTQHSDQPGLAEAYRVYGFFFRSHSLGQFERRYREVGFLDREARFDERFQRSVDYFQRAQALFEAQGRDDKVTNVWLNMGFSYEFMKDTPHACAAYDKSLEASRRFQRARPDARLDLPAGVTSYEAYLNGHKTRLGCP